MLVEITEIDSVRREGFGLIVSRISYSQELANNITINFYPVTYNHYLNVLGLHLPGDFPSEAEGDFQSEAKGKYIYLY